MPQTNPAKAWSIAGLSRDTGRLFSPLQGGRGHSKGARHEKIRLPENSGEGRRSGGIEWNVLIASQPSRAVFEGTDLRSRRQCGHRVLFPWKPQGADRRGVLWPCTRAGERGCSPVSVTQTLGARTRVLHSFPPSPRFLLITSNAAKGVW